MSVENVVAEVLQIKQEFETLCEEAEAQVEALQKRLSEVEMPSGTRDVDFTVNLIHPRQIAQQSFSQIVLIWSFQSNQFMVRGGGAATSSLLSKTDDWAFIELVAAIPRLLPKVEATVMTNLPEKKLLLAAARAALEACATSDEP